MAKKVIIVCILSVLATLCGCLVACNRIPKEAVGTYSATQSSYSDYSIELQSNGKAILSEDSIYLFWQEFYYADILKYEDRDVLMEKPNFTFKIKGNTITIEDKNFNLSVTGGIRDDIINIFDILYWKEGLDSPHKVCGNLLYTVSENGNYTISGLADMNATTVTIPAEINGVKVTSIRRWAFDRCANLESVIIEPGITVIEYGAFDSCTNLKSITIPNSVTTIERQAFCRCSSLESIEIPNSVTRIDDSLFDRCTNLKSISLPDSITSIGKYAFMACANLKSITIPKSVTTIGSEAFCDCYRLVEIYNLSEFEISLDLFKRGSNLVYNVLDIYTYINTPSKLVEQGDFTFYNGKNALLLNYTGNKTQLTLPADFNGKAYEIYNYAFYGNNNLEQITIPYGITKIEEYTFAECSALSSISLPDSLTSIGYRAFYNCANLKHITIPESVIDIEIYAFYNCISIENINIPNSLTNIKTGVFSDCSSLKSITIPNSVTSIEKYAFSNCISLESISIPESVTKIESYAFNNCSSLKTITIPNSVTSIGRSAFNSCISLKSITIPNSVTSIEAYVFKNCNALLDVIYQGTKSEWSAIEKKDNWDAYTSDFTIHCDDGDIVKSE